MPIRYGRMWVSPFTFFRGAALIMAPDLAATARSGLNVQSCGDACQEAVQGRLIQGSRQHYGGGLDVQVEVGERLAGGGTDLPEHPHVVLDWAGIVHLRALLLI